MPSTLVHVALAGLTAAALLGTAFGYRGVAVVLLVASLPDLDAFAGLVVGGAHRSLGHNLFLPMLTASLLAYDTELRTVSWLRERWGNWGVRTGWVAVFGLVVAGIGPDYVTNGVNLFWPLHDAFYSLDGKLVISNKRGIVQTFIDLTPEQTRTTDDVHYSTGVDPAPGDEPKNPERVFPVVNAGWQLLVIATSASVLGIKFRWGDGSRTDGTSS